MDTTTIESTVIEYLIRITDEDEIGDYLDLDLFDEGFLDSLAGIELMMQPNKTFDLNLDSSAFETVELNTGNKIIGFIRDKTGA